jgi:hypothetical protein
MTDECCISSSWCCPFLIQEENVHLIRSCVMQWTSAKCGQRMMPIIGHQRKLSCSRHLPNVAKKVPLVRGPCLNADFDQTWSKTSPSLENFVLLWTLTKCGPKCAPCWRTLSHCRLQPNVVQNVPLVRGLCLTADFDQIWSKHVLLIGGLCHNAYFDQMWNKHVLFDKGLRFATKFNHIWINNALIIKKRLVPNKQSLSINQCRTETAIFDYVAI